MKWLHAVAAFLTLLLIVTRSRCLITNFNTRKPVYYSVCGTSKPRLAAASRARHRACARAAVADEEDAKIWRDPDIIVEDKVLGDYECDG